MRCRHLNPNLPDPDFASFQVYVQPDQSARILDKNKWPSWIIVRPWEKRSRARTAARNRSHDSSEPQKIETVIGVHRPMAPQSQECHLRSIYSAPENWYDTELYNF